MHKLFIQNILYCMIIHSKIFYKIYVIFRTREMKGPVYSTDIGPLSPLGWLVQIIQISNFSKRTGMSENLKT